MKTVSAYEMREIDRRAIEEFSIPGVVLMENAGRELALHTMPLVAQHPGARVAVLCGPGNNGGDGLVAARFLHAAGYAPEIILMKPPSQFSPGAAVNFAIVIKCGIPVTAFTGDTGLAGSAAIIDALLGTGIRGEVTGIYRDAIRRINASGIPVAAADIPSGLDADTGVSMGEAVKATVTVTMGLVKKGLLEPPAMDYVGKLIVADIGLPRRLII